MAHLSEKKGDTVHIDVIDAEGNMVSITPSGGWLQSSPTMPGLGFCLNSRAQMFWLEPGLPTSLEPGKRPRTTLTPSLALKDGTADGLRHARRRPAGPVAAGLLPALRPSRAEPAGGDRPAAVPFHAFPANRTCGRCAGATSR
jgi:hypothetical protein